LSDEQAREIKQALQTYLVLTFKDQNLTPEGHVALAKYFGTPEVHPIVQGMEGYPEIIKVIKNPGETTQFGDSWHSDNSFFESPTTATILHAQEVPPVGGDTLFADGCAAWDALPAPMQARLRGLRGVHSARRGYARDGLYGERDQARGRSMAIRFGDAALATRTHPIARVHPETGRTALFVSPGYTIGIEGLDASEANPILLELFEHQKRPEFVYRHRWAAGMLLVWDNRRLVHAATGGYEGHRRLLHRITIAEREGTAREAVA